MEIYKQAQLTQTGTPDPAALEQINRQAKSPLTAQQVYHFSVRLCDDQPDRDFERFDTAALPELARLFIGKTGIVDHNWSADCQRARIYDAAVEARDGVSFIRASAYMLRGEKNWDAIEEIEGGIRREVSVGCAMGRSVCSVCGSDYGTCQHRKGEVYNGQTCCAVLTQPLDAYEFSFVAVPAQPQAGVLKHKAPQAAGPDAPEQAELLRLSALGERYLTGLRGEVRRLGLALELGLSPAELEQLAGALDPEALERVRDSWTKQAAARFPAGPQLPGDSRYACDEAAFRV